MKILGWVAFYTGNRTFSSAAHEWEVLPNEGVLAVSVVFDKIATNGQHYKEVLSGKRRYFMAIGSSGNIFMKGSLWTERKLLKTYDTKPEWIKEGIWDDDETMQSVLEKAKGVTYDAGKPVIPRPD